MKTRDEIIEDVEERLVALGLRQKLKDWDIDPQPESGLIVLDRMQTDDPYLNTGVADATMDVFTQYCDEEGFNAELTVRPLNPQTSEVRLRGLYARHGFVSVLPGNKMARKCWQAGAP